jgi:hypothetical protein
MTERNPNQSRRSTSIARVALAGMAALGSYSIYREFADSCFSYTAIYDKTPEDPGDDAIYEVNSRQCSKEEVPIDQQSCPPTDSYLIGATGEVTMLGTATLVDGSCEIVGH